MFGAVCGCLFVSVLLLLMLLVLFGGAQLVILRSLVEFGNMANVCLENCEAQGRRMRF